MNLKSKFIPASFNILNKVFACETVCSSSEKKTEVMNISVKYVLKYIDQRFLNKKIRQSKMQKKSKHRKTSVYLLIEL